MAKAITKILATFLISSLLAIGGLANPGGPSLDRLDQQDKRKDKEKENVPEKQKGGGDRGGKGDDKKDDKKGGRKP
jgi:hypothetical protein